MARSDKKPKRIVETKGTKNAIVSRQAGSYYSLCPTFSFGRYDAEAPWSASSDGKPTVDSVLKMLGGMEQTTWGAIRQASGGRAHGTNSHPISVNELSKEAQARVFDTALNESELFSLRLTSTARLWGIIEPDSGRFYAIWFDPDHRVYPVDK